jgi:hypothetical protein
MLRRIMMLHLGNKRLYGIDDKRYIRSLINEGEPNLALFDIGLLH